MSQRQCLARQPHQLMSQRQPQLRRVSNSQTQTQQRHNSVSIPASCQCHNSSVLPVANEQHPVPHVTNNVTNSTGVPSAIIITSSKRHNSPSLASANKGVSPRLPSSNRSSQPCPHQPQSQPQQYAPVATTPSSSPVNLKSANIARLTNQCPAN